MKRVALLASACLAPAFAQSAYHPDFAETINTLVRTNPLAAHSEIGVHVRGPEIRQDAVRLR